MSEHWRVGVVERAVLETLDELGAQPVGPHRKCANVVARMADERGVSPRYGYDALCALARPWLEQIPLVDFHGNLGSPDDQPANARYTEARLSRAGVFALAAERGSGPKVPVALINGNLHVDGAAPPYSPTRVLAALRAVIDDPRLADAEIVELVGPPDSPTGCRVSCDYHALGAGEPTELLLTAQLTIETRDDRDAIVVSHLPLGVGVETVMEALAARVESHARVDRLGDQRAFRELGLPLRDIRVDSDGTTGRIVCVLRRGAKVAEVEAQIAATWGVRTRTQVGLAAPLAQLIRELVDDDADAQRSTLAALA